MYYNIDGIFVINFYLSKYMRRNPSEGAKGALNSSTAAFLFQSMEQSVGWYLVEHKHDEISTLPVLASNTCIIIQNYYYYKKYLF